MDLFIKNVAFFLVCAILALYLQNIGKEFSVLLVLGACAIGFVVFGTFLSPIMDFLQRLRSITDLDDTLLQVLLKAMGVCILTEMASTVCNDAGCASLGKVLQILSSAAILWISIPLLDKLLDMILKILGGI